MEHLTFDPELWSLIPSHFAREYRILPFGWEDDGVALVLLLDDESHETPEDCLAAQETIRFMLGGRPIRFVHLSKCDSIGTSEFDETLDRWYALDLPESLSEAVSQQWQLIIIEPDDEGAAEIIGEMKSSKAYDDQLIGGVAFRHVHSLNELHEPLLSDKLVDAICLISAAAVRANESSHEILKSISNAVAHCLIVYNSDRNSSDFATAKEFSSEVDSLDLAKNADGRLILSQLLHRHGRQLSS